MITLIAYHYIAIQQLFVLEHTI